MPSMKFGCTDQHAWKERAGFLPSRTTSFPIVWPSTVLRENPALPLFPLFSFHSIGNSPRSMPNSAKPRAARSFLCMYSSGFHILAGANPTLRSSSPHAPYMTTSSLGCLPASSHKRISASHASYCCHSLDASPLPLTLYAGAPSKSLEMSPARVWSKAARNCILITGPEFLALAMLASPFAFGWLPRRQSVASAGHGIDGWLGGAIIGAPLLLEPPSEDRVVRSLSRCSAATCARHCARSLSNPSRSLSNPSCIALRISSASAVAFVAAASLSCSLFVRRISCRRCGVHSPARRCCTHAATSHFSHASSTRSFSTPSLCASLMRMVVSSRFFSHGIVGKGLVGPS